ncbi:hypothetical protein ACHAWF_004148 [Thalassiosira exigua]
MGCGTWGGKPVKTNIVVFWCLISVYLITTASTAWVWTRVASTSGGSAASLRTSSAPYRFLAHNSDCLKARSNSVSLLLLLCNLDYKYAQNQNGNLFLTRMLHPQLPGPYVNLGFPKMGTTSLHTYFQCGGRTSAHFWCTEEPKRCAACIKGSVKRGLPPLSRCGKADMYAQIDNGFFFPQIALLEELVRGLPDATFFLTFRNMTKWYKSITNFPPKLGRKKTLHMDERWMKGNMTGSPPLYDAEGNKRESDPNEFSEWYCKHVERVRELIARNPSHSLVEIDIEDPGVGWRMEDMFGIDRNCWGHTNVNAENHQDLNLSEVVLTQHLRPDEEYEAEVVDLLKKTKMTDLQSNVQVEDGGDDDGEAKDGEGDSEEEEEEGDDDGSYASGIEDANGSDS